MNRLLDVATFLASAACVAVCLAFMGSPDLFAAAVEWLKP